MDISAFYFSGTGNTEYTVRYLKDIFIAEGANFSIYDIADKKADYLNIISGAETLLFAFPAHNSHPPFIVTDFVEKYNNAFLDKEVLIAVTQMIASGDTAAHFARLLKKLGADVCMAQHFNMPNNISDFPLLKIKNGAECEKILEKTKNKLRIFAHDFINGKRRIHGRNIFLRVGGGLQRLFTARTEKKLRSALKIDMPQCGFCTQCVKVCPAKNIIINNNKIETLNKCTLCYRCVNICPHKAISLISKRKPRTQYKGAQYKGTRIKNIK